MTATATLIDALRQLTPEKIRRRLEEINSEERSLRILLRAAQAQARKQARESEGAAAP
jgi:hypothetical protein